MDDLLFDFAVVRVGLLLMLALIIGAGAASAWWGWKNKGWLFRDQS